MIHLIMMLSLLMPWQEFTAPHTNNYTKVRSTAVVSAPAPAAPAPAPIAVTPSRPSRGTRP